MPEILSEHVPIVTAIATGDTRSAAAHMEAHLVSTATLLMAQAATADDPAPGTGWADRLRAHLYVAGRGAAPK